jgi:hypothetical protein
MLGDLIMQLLRIERVAKTAMIKGVSHQHGKAPDAEVSSANPARSRWVWARAASALTAVLSCIKVVELLIFQ